MDGADRGGPAAAHPRRRHCRRWTSSTPRTSRGPICWPRPATPPTRCSTSPAAPRPASIELAEALQRVMGSDLGLEFGPPRRCQRGHPAAGGHLRRGEPTRLEGRDRAGRGPVPPRGLVAGPAMIPVIRPWLGAEEAAAAAEAIASGWVAQGPRVAEFEAAFAEASGRRARGGGLLLHGRPAPGPDRGGRRPPGTRSSSPRCRSSPPPTRHATSAPRPVFADVDPATQNLTPATVEPLLTERTRAVILVDQAGVPADLDAMRALCDPRGITVVEDAACAAGATYRGRPAGAGSQPRRVLLPPPQAAHHRRGGHDHHSRPGAGGQAAPPARARHERQRGRPACRAASRSSSTTSRSVSTTG